MSDCASIRDDLKAYMDGELPLLRRAAVRLHLARCKGCRKELAVLRRISEELRGQETGELNPAVRYRILAEAVEIAAQREPVRSAAAGRRLRPLPAWSAAAAAVLIVAACYPLLNRSLESALSEKLGPHAGTVVPTDTYEVPSTAAAGSGAPTSSSSSAPKVATGGGETRRGGARAHATLPRHSAPTPAVHAAPSPATSSADRSAPAAGDAVVANSPTRRFASDAVAAPTVAGSRAPGDLFLQKGLDVGQLSSSLDRDATSLAERARGGSGEQPSMEPGAFGGRSHQAGVVRTVSLELEVDRVEARTADVAAIVRDANGTVDNQLVSKSDGSPETAFLQLRVPAECADAVVRELGKLGTAIEKQGAAGPSFGAMRGMAAGAVGGAAGALGGGASASQTPDQKGEGASVGTLMVKRFAARSGQTANAETRPSPAGQSAGAPAQDRRKLGADQASGKGGVSPAAQGGPHGQAAPAPASARAHVQTGAGQEQAGREASAPAQAGGGFRQTPQMVILLRLRARGVATPPVGSGSPGAR